MKPTKISKVRGISRIEKYRTLLEANGKLYVQKKLNGIGFRARLLGSDFQMWTTKNKWWPAGFFANQPWFESLRRKAVDLPSHTLYGEITCDSLALADLGGMVSVNRLDPPADKPELIFNVYDVDMPQPFGHRKRHATVPTVEIQRGEEDKLVYIYNTIVESGGEGIVLRADPCYVGPGVHPQAWKDKRLHDDEGLCIGVTEGLGKRVGMLGSMAIRLRNGQSVNIGGGEGLSDERLRELYHNPPIGKQVTFTYEELSEYGIPLRGQFVAVRDYE